MRGVDGEAVTVSTRGGEPIDDEVTIEATPGKVRIRDDERGLKFGPLRVRTRGTADLDIDVPRTARVNLRTLSGDVDAAGIGAASHWASASGDLRLDVDGGPVSAESMSGDVWLTATAAIEVKARSVSGDVNLRGTRFDVLAASTTSGDIRVTADLGDRQDHLVSSVSGDVDITTASPIRLETQTITGDVRASGTRLAEGGRGRRAMVIGAGTIGLSVRTTSGDIRLRGVEVNEAAAAGAWSAPDVPPASDRPASPAMPSAPAMPAAPSLPAAPAAPNPPIASTPPVVVVAEAEAAPNLVRPTGGAAAPVDRREAARLEILRALERGDLDIEAASHKLEIIEDAGPRYFRGWC